MNFFRTACFVAISLAGLLNAQGQGFVNLDFEAANISQSQSSGLVNTSDALPGWFAAGGYVFGYYATQIGFNNVTSGVPQVTLLGTSGVGQSSIEGGFSVFLQGQGLVGPGNDPGFASSIGQTGFTPLSAQSILFKAQPGTETFLLTFGIQNVPFVVLATGSNYNLYGADMSAFADSNIQLEFAAQGAGTGWNLDSIEFSSQPIPEPEVFSLLVFGGLILRSRISN
jgi:hypothetical protein